MMRLSRTRWVISCARGFDYAFFTSAAQNKVQIVLSHPSRSPARCFVVNGPLATVSYLVNGQQQAGLKPMNGATKKVSDLEPRRVNTTRWGLYCCFGAVHFKSYKPDSSASGRIDNASTASHLYI